MTKLQQIKRVNQSLLHSVNIPLEIIEETGWEKGDDLILELEKTPEGRNKIVITKENELIKFKEEVSNNG